jgi:hypothetical protein
MRVEEKNVVLNVSNITDRFSDINRQQEEEKLFGKTVHFNREDNYENFKEQTWNALSPDLRKAALQCYENELAEEQKRTKRTVETGEKPKDANIKDGNYFNPDTPDILHIDMSLVQDGSNPFDAMDAIAHEGRHHTQYDEREGKNTKQYSTEQSERIKSSVNYREYDANAYTNAKMNSKKMQDKFANDTNYIKYKSGQAKTTKDNMDYYEKADKDNYKPELNQRKTRPEWESKYRYNDVEKHRSESEEINNENSI